MVFWTVCAQFSYVICSIKHLVTLPQKQEQNVLYKYENNIPWKKTKQREDKKCVSVTGGKNGDPNHIQSVK